MSIFINIFYHLKERAEALFKNILNPVSVLFSRLSRVEKYLVYFLLGIIVISLALAVREHFFIKKVEMPASGGTYTEGTIGEIRFFIPVLNQTEAEKDLDRLIFSSLIKFNQKDEIIPDLAEKWEIGEDGKTYKLFLKEARWQDNKPVIADDVIYTIGLVKNQEIKSPYFENFKDVEVGKIDDKTVTFTLKNPASSFLSCLDIPILPKHLLENTHTIDLTASSFAKNPVGSGPFRIKEMEGNGKLISVTLNRNDDYFAKKPYLSKFVYKVYQEKEDLINAFESGRINGYLGEESNNQNNKITLHRYMAVFFNLNRLKNKDLRKALSYSINRDEIIQGIAAEKIYYPILPGDLGYKEAEKIEYNPEMAKRLYAKIKNPPNPLKMLVKEGGENLIIADIIKKQLEVLGTIVEIESATNSHFENLAQERSYDLLLVGLDQKEDPDPYPFWHSNFAASGYNFSGLKNKEADKLLEDGRKTINPDVRRQKYERFIEIIQQETPAVFLYRNFYYYNHSSIIKGVEDALVPNKSDRFWNVENWYIKVKKIKK